ncbi:MAG: hypothetical protein II919_00790 [Lachnospiraceae bacterium]|nr:hypothetical protein [Lachnospiraceae bacterium]
MNLPEDFKVVLEAVTNKRAKFVIDTILEKGFCSTEDLKNAGYEHAPRAARDVREMGIPLDTFKIKDSMGKNIAAYKFGDWEEAKKANQLAKTSGRTQLTEKLKMALIEKYGAKCRLYGEEYPARLLQPDHRIPYEIGGNPPNMMDLDYFMLLSPSANRDKSWACEHCVNWIEKNIDMCKLCYYAYPENYEHIAGKTEKRLNINFNDEDMELYNNIVQQAEQHGRSYEEQVKRMIAYSKKIKDND